MNQLFEHDLRIETYQTLEALESVRSAWEALLGDYPSATTFSTWEWLAPWWRAFAKQQELLAIGFWRQQELVGLAAMSVTKERGKGGVPLRVLRLMGDGSGDSDNLDIPVRPEFAQGISQELMEYLENNRRLWDVCQFNTLPSASCVVPHLVSLAEKRSWRVYQSERVASVIALPNTWEEYLQQLSSEDQKNLSRYARRMEKRYKTRIYRITQENELNPCLEALFRLHQERWEADGQTGSFGSVDRRDFYYDLSRALLSRGWLELWALELDGAIAAAQFAFRYRDAVYQLQEGNDPQRSSDRVGFILRGEVMKQLIAEGVRVYDFLGGQPGYKARWGAKIAHYRDIHLARSASLGSTYLSALRAAGRTKEWLRKNLPQSAWGVLHKVNVGLRDDNGTRKPKAKDEEDANSSQSPSARPEIPVPAAKVNKKKEE